MPRFARVVITGEPYHITHRGNHRGEIFFDDDNREAYLAMLASACNRFALDVWGYCLMGNHIHLVAVPRERLSVACGVGRTHMRYSRWINRERGWTGHLWANRFHSSVLDEDHLWMRSATWSRTPCGPSALFTYRTRFNQVPSI